ncbi:MAG: threonine/serine exporter family protein [Acidaminococcaceae bacterium]|nr:threonine/serine exporter family protein [Acidaminococcaceae bacterium]
MLVSIFFAFIATIAFGKLFNTPRRVLVLGGLVGAIGFAVYIYMKDVLGYSSMLSNFAGTIVLSIISEVFARIFKEPVTVFSIPGIIPLVPGLPLYRAMNFFMLNAYNVGMEKMVQASLDATAIALGILLISSIARLFKNSKTRALQAKIKE